MKIDKLSVPYAQVPNELLSDPKVSLKAKGMWSYIQSKPNDYDFSADRIISETSDGKDSVQSALKELEESGYLLRKRLQSGRVDYCLTFPKLENPTVGKSPNGKTRPVSKNKLSKVSRDNNIITYEGEKPISEVVTPIIAPSDETKHFFEMVIASAEEFQVFVTKMSESTKLPPAMVANELKHFILHWTERNKTGTKQRWESEKTFEVRRRLVTWFNNKKTNFGRNKGASVNGVENKYQVNFQK